MRPSRRRCASTPSSANRWTMAGPKRVPPRLPRVMFHRRPPPRSRRSWPRASFRAMIRPICHLPSRSTRIMVVSTAAVIVMHAPATPTGVCHRGSISRPSCLPSQTLPNCCAASCRAPATNAPRSTSAPTPTRTSRPNASGKSPAPSWRSAPNSINRSASSPKTRW